MVPKDPDSAPTALEHGDEMLADGQLDAAETAYREALSLDPTSAEALYSMGCIASQRGDFAEAASWALRAIEAEPGHGGGHLLAGSSLLGLGQYRNALGHLEPLRDDLPGMVDVEIALCYEGLGELARAEHELRHVLQNDPAYLTRHSAIARYDHNPFWADVHANLGRILQLQESNEDARLHYHLAKRIDPTVELYPGYLDIMRREDLEDHPIDRLQEETWLEDLNLDSFGDRAESVRTLWGLTRSSSGDELVHAASDLSAPERAALLPVAIELIHAHQRIGDFQLSAQLRAIADFLAGEDGSQLFSLVASPEWRRLLEIAEKLQSEALEDHDALSAAARERPSSPEQFLTLLGRFSAADADSSLPVVRVGAAALAASTPRIGLSADRIVGNTWWEVGDLASAERQFRAAADAAADADADDELLAVLDLLSRLQSERGHLDQATETCLRYVLEADRLSDSQHRVRARFTLAVALGRSGEAERARAVAQEADEIARQDDIDDLRPDLDRLLDWTGFASDVELPDGAPGVEVTPSAAEAQYERACSLRERGLNEDAHAEAQGAYAAATAESNGALAQQALFLRGVIRADIGRADEARDDLEDCLRRLPRYDSWERGRVYLALATLPGANQDLDQVTMQLTHALASARQSGDPGLETSVREALADALIDHDPEAAFYHRSRAAHASQDASSAERHFANLAERVRDEHAQGYDAAPTVRSMIEQLSEVDTPGERMATAIATGVDALDVDQPHLAAEPLGQALTIARSQEWRNIETEIAARTALGTSFRLTGRYREAIDQYRASLDLADRVNEDLDKADLYGRLGIALRYNGELDDAVDAYKTSIRIWRGYAHSHAVAINQMNLASALFLLGRRQQGLDSALQALDELENQGDEAMILRTLGLLAAQLYSADDLPHRFAVRLREGAQQSTDPFFRAWYWTDYGQQMVAEGNVEDAERALGHAIDVHRAHHDTYNEIKSCLNRSRVLRAHRPATAVADAEHALRMATAGGNDELAIEAEQELLLIALAGNDNDAIETLHDSLVTRWTARRRSLRRDTDRVALANDAVQLTKLCTEHYLTIGDNVGVTNTLDQARALGLSDILATRTTSASEHGQNVTRTTRDVLRAMDVPAVAVSLDVVADEVIVGIFRAGDDEAVYESTHATRNKVSELIETFRNEMLVYGGRSAQTWPESLRQLLAPALDQIRVGEHVVLFPEGDLQCLPLHAVPSAEGAPLISSCPVVYAPSVAALDTSRTRSLHPSGDAMVAVGVAFSDEARAVSLITGGQCLSGRSLSKDSVRTVVKQAPLIHFACHGYFDTEDFLDSGLLLRVTDTPLRDDILSLRDLEDWTLQAELVVLSACETGLGRAVPSDFLGLARGILGAGARAVLATLWPVDDAATQAFMLDFYEEMVRQGDATGVVDLAATLARTQRRASEIRAPYDWAAFKLIGWPRIDWKSANE